MMRPTISAIQVRPQYLSSNCILHNAIVGSSELPILWSPKLYTELGRGGCKHISHPRLKGVRVVSVKVVLSFTHVRPKAWAHLNSQIQSLEEVLYP